jgi:hypothetical protein
VLMDASIGICSTETPTGEIFVIAKKGRTHATTRQAEAHAAAA